MKRQVEFLKSMGVTTKFTSEDRETKRPKMLFKRLGLYPDCFGAYKF